MKMLVYVKQINREVLAEVISFYESQELDYLCSEIRSLSNKLDVYTDGKEYYAVDVQNAILTCDEIKEYMEELY